MVYSHKTEYYLPIKKNEALTCATKWMNLENVMLSVRHVTQKATYHMIHLKEISRIGTFIEIEDSLVVSNYGSERGIESDWFWGFILGQ